MKVIIFRSVYTMDFFANYFPGSLLASIVSDLLSTFAQKVQTVLALDILCITKKQVTCL